MGSKPNVNAPAEEGRLLLRSFAKHLPAVIDAKDAILSMEKGGSKHWRQMEWIGFYPEFWFEENLATKLGTKRGPHFGNMSFDLQRQHVWDLKAHSTGTTGTSNWAPLNDIEAIRGCINAHGGVGFLVLSGPCTYDEDGSFKKWHENLKGGPSDYSKRIASRGATSRRRKTSFTPNHLIAFRFSSLDEINRAKREHWLKGFQEGMRNSNDNARRAKVMVDLANIGKWALIDEVRR
jgi:hypothetical protein